MNASFAKHIDELRAAVPSLEILTDEASCRSRGRDTWVRSLMKSRLGDVPAPGAVLKPHDTEEVSQCLSWAQDTETVLVPFGLGSGVCGAVLMEQDQVVLDMSEMDQILDIDETSLTVTVQPGMRGSDFEEALAARGFTMGHWPQSIALSSVGGWVATRASGQFSTLYGNIEEMFLGCEVVMAGGRTMRIPVVPRSATGPDLRALFMGSEGTLGVLTEVTFRIHRAPEKQIGLAVSFDGLTAGSEALREIVQAGWTPAVTRLYDVVEAGRNFSGVAETDRPVLLILGEGNAERVTTEAAGIATICSRHGGKSHGEAPVLSWLDHRNNVPTFESLLDQGILADTIEVAIDWSQLITLWDNVCAAGNAREDVLAMSGHVSHCYTQGANIYFTFISAEKDLERALATYDAVWDTTMRITHEMGGTIAHHHGIGRVRRRWLGEELGTATELLRTLKSALDPKGILNPGALIPSD
ncbi:MAG: alkyldihydroxyacetonephosphate synthase [Hyphomicrobiaceae bacterium]